MYQMIIEGKLKFGTGDSSKQKFAQIFFIYNFGLDFVGRLKSPGAPRDKGSRVFEFIGRKRAFFQVIHFGSSYSSARNVGGFLYRDYSSFVSLNKQKNFPREPPDLYGYSKH